MDAEYLGHKAGMGIHARMLFDNPATIEALASIENKIINAWRTSGIGQADQRELLWAQLHALDLFIKELQGYKKSEKLEREKIEEIVAAKKPRVELIE